MSRHVRRALVGITAAVIALLSLGPSAQAHGFTSTVYADVTSGEEGHIRTALKLEYDLFVVSAADTEGDDSLFRTGNAAFEDGDTAAQAEALNTHAKSALSYVTERFSVTSGGAACTPARVGDFTMGRQEGVPYAGLLLDWTCPGEGGDREVRSELFPDAETFVTGTKTIVTYEIDGRSGSAALDAGHPSFSVGQSWYERFWEFFRLGAEHLLGGIDHILFLLALIAGSRRLREIVLAATSFTLAHSVTFMLAALGLVDVPSRVVEPVIALSIAVVAAGTSGGSGGVAITRANSTWAPARYPAPAVRPQAVASAWTGPAGSVSGWCSASASCTAWASRGRWASTRRSRGPCSGRSWCSTSVSKRCSWRSSPWCSRCWPSSGTVRRGPLSGRPAPSPRVCASWG